MKQHTKIVIRSTSVVLVCILLVLLYASTAFNRTPVYTLWAPPPVQDLKIKSYVHHDKRLAGKRTQFLVLVQAESCLANHLSSEEAFGNATFCQCDVLVLTFKKECNETSPAHIKYVFKPGTSWNEGRNFLYEVGKNRSEMYLYYIFTDDDIQLTTELSINPWRTFLDFLLEIEPAVGVVDFPQFLKLILRGKKRLGCGADINSTNYISAPNFDSAFNAFHYQAIDYILPYPTQFDKLSWWYSGYYSKVKCDIMFPGQVLVLTKIIAINFQHRSYPRKNPLDSHNWNIIMREVEAPLPEKYRNTELMKAWKRLGIKNSDKSASLCFPPPPPHKPIRPFSYLESMANDTLS